MTLAIMQPYFFPYIGYFQLVVAADKFIIYDDVAFIKQGWIARNRILVNEKPHMFSIPVADVSSFRLIKDTELHPRLFPLWRGKFIRTLQQAYSKAPYVKPVVTLVEEALFSEDKFISRLATCSIQAVINYLALSTQVIDTSRGYGHHDLKGQARVVAICLQEGATCYVNVPGGKELYEGPEFRKHGIELTFIDPNLSPYPQASVVFHPALSMIDVLMYNSKEDCQIMLGIRK